MIKKIIFLFDYHPFSKRDYDRYGIDLIRENGFEVEVWDLTPFLKPKVFHGANKACNFDFPGYRLFFNEKEAIKSILKLEKDNLIVCIIGYYFDTCSIFKAISRKSLPYAGILVNNIPTQQNSGKKTKFQISKILRKFRNASVSRIKDLLFSKVPFYFWGVKPTSFLMADGDKCLNHRYPESNSTRILRMHAFDYDIYLREKDAGSRNNKEKDKFAVFLDEYLPFHPDYSYIQAPSFSNEEDYYPVLCKFFKYVEESLRIKVVIAAHPRSEYEKLPDHFKGRQVIKGETARLVRDCEFVMMHSSTSINFAVLFKKPIIFITTKSLQNSPQSLYINLFASSLGKEVINISEENDIDFKKQLNIVGDKYSEYKNNFIKKEGSVELPAWQIFSRYVSSINQKGT